MAATNTLNVTLVKSTIGRIEKHKATVRGLGLRRLNHTVTVEDTPAVRGMIRAVSYLLNVTEGGEAVAKKAKPAAKKPSAKSTAKEESKKTTQTASTENALPKKYLNKDGSEKLTAVEGVGPKTMQILVDGGIETFAKIAAKTSDELREVVKAGGGRLVESINTWPEQAALLANGDVEAFEKLAAELDGGVRK